MIEPLFGVLTSRETKKSRSGSVLQSQRYASMSLYLIILQKSDKIGKSSSTVRRVYVNRPSTNVPRESERAMGKKKQVAKKDQAESKRPEPKEAHEGCLCCTERSTTKKPRTFFVQKL
jgi:hypothetical protein